MQARTSWTAHTFTSSNLLFCLGIALLYIVTARISQVFAIEPGNVTPVWIPSGLMLALALKYGPRIWPGVFVGAFLGNIWAYISLDTAIGAASAVASATLNGIGDVIAVVVFAQVIKKQTGSDMPFRTLPNFMLFGLWGVFIGPLTSALFGVTGLTLFGFVQAEQYLFALTNWWVGDGVGVVLFAPLLLSWLNKSTLKTKYFSISLLFSIAIFSVFTLSVFELIHLPRWMVMACVIMLPVGFALMLQQGQRAVYTAQVVVASIAVFATFKQLGPFIENELLPPLIGLQLFIGAFSSVIFCIAVMLYQRQLMTLKLQKQQRKMESLYQHDPLTGLWNRYRIEEFLQFELNRSKRLNETFAVFMIDIDDFKQINDQYGHLEGDRILVEFAKAINSHIRDVDLFGRWGGEEFLIITVEQTQENAQQFADKMVKVISEHDFSLEEPVTISIGYTLSLEGDNKASILERADEALYTAKKGGKDQAFLAWPRKAS
ncbi:diguanylate cyclase [Aliiglaciecola sp. CAU 1673]|uniref:sensor domain-containing diguanylate cyclase n=1 Tax=Aliiglaciecola sp. CAU 1673 TaxID=3032595 RepID=UPI0023D9AA86|nr:diguanylate cyclase [Aliiglaciecola sp. CAU 1673]MDF2176888.1 diguanylate cyclase [Aliiglaciecola sp. CAU 1673]